MASTCLTLCFGIYLVFSLLLHIGEVVLNAMFVIHLYDDSTKRTWFTIMLGLMLLPMVTVQLVSALLLLHKRGEHLTTFQAFGTAMLHVFQLGFVWRHIRLITEDEIKWKKRDLADLCILRLFYTFSASLPIFGMQVYLIVKYNSFDWLIISATTVTMCAIAWALASYRRQNEADIAEGTVLTFPGTIFRLIWRFGEIISRILSLIVFASLYKSWIFLVILLHWLTMMVCIFTSVFGFFELVGVSRVHRFFLSTLIAYIYIFCYINFNSQRTQWRYITFYTIMFLENAVLLIVWYLSAVEDNSLRTYTIIFIACITFVIGIVSMIMYYRFFHIPAKKLFADGKDNVCVQDSCINCKLSLCNKHSKYFQRPFSAGWVSQYQKALYQGNYYKNMQDSLLDSMSEWEEISSSSDSASEGRNHSKREKSVTFHSAGTYSHKRFLPKSGLSDSDSDSTSMTSRQNINQSSSDSEVSDTVNPLSCENTSQTQLLTDSWEKLIEGKDNITNENVQNLQSFRPISAQNLEDWYSDGYSTDHSSSDFQLPITVLAKLNKCRISVASDSTQCTMCKHLKINRKRPKTYSRSSQEKIIEENYDLESNTIVLETPRSAAWYNCSESGDSAFPQETISTTCPSNIESDEDGISETSFEMII